MPPEQVRYSPADIEHGSCIGDCPACGRRRLYPQVLTLGGGRVVLGIACEKCSACWPLTDDAAVYGPEKPWDFADEDYGNPFTGAEPTPAPTEMPVPFLQRAEASA